MASIYQDTDGSMSSLAPGKIVVIIFTLQDTAIPIFEIAQSSADYDKYIWVGGDGWSGRGIRPGAERAAANAIAVQPLGRVVEGFDEYFTSLRPETHTINPWFQPYWEQKFNCTMSAPGTGNQDYENDCKSTDRISDVNGTYTRHLNTYNTMNAVFAFAHALRAMHTDLCLGMPGVCSAMSIVKGEQLMEYIHNVTFKAPSGLELKFYGNEGPARYSIMNFVSTGTGYEWRQVGTFSESPNNTNLTLWENFMIGNYRPSYCSAPCGVGEVKSSQIKCCWTCTKCGYFQYAKAGNCVIDGICHTSGDTKSGESCLVCRPDSSANYWSTSMVPECIGKPPPQKEDDDRTKIIILAVVCAVFGALLIVGAIYIIRLKTGKGKKKSETGEYELTEAYKNDEE